MLQAGGSGRGVLNGLQRELRGFVIFSRVRALVTWFLLKGIPNMVRVMDLVMIEKPLYFLKMVRLKVEVLKLVVKF